VLKIENVIDIVFIECSIGQDDLPNTTQYHLNIIKIPIQLIYKIL